MIRVNNNTVVRRLSQKSFRANRTRNIISVIAIVLTTLMFTSLFTMGIGTVESMQKASMHQAGGDGHAVLKYLNDQQFDVLKNDETIKELAYNMALCDSVDNPELLKRRTEFWYYDTVGLKLGFIELDEGHVPQLENEVIADTKTLMLLGVPLKLGEKVSLELDIRGQSVKRDFVLSGWFTGDPSFSIGQIFSSRAYVDANSEELKCTVYSDCSFTGAINAYIMFNNSFNLQGKLDKVLENGGFSSVVGDPNYVDGNVNWSYVSTNFSMDATTLTIIICGLLVITLTGYLIIYNIFQISIAKDIRFYGLLKTIGTTSRQIRRLISRQALTLSALGIPVGLFLGFFSGRALVPIVMSNSSYHQDEVFVSANPVIFIGSAIFALLTVFISTLRPARLAGSVSPVEAIRYTECDTPGKKSKKGRDGAKLTGLALSNVWRNKKRTVLVIVSLSLSVVLLDLVVTLAGAVDMDKFASKFSDCDFLVAHADYFNNDFYGKENETSESLISAIEGLDGFEEGGRLFGGRENLFVFKDPNNSQVYNVDAPGCFYGTIFGLEDLPMERLELLDGDMDMEKLLSGDYILEGVQLDDNNKPEWDSAHYALGDKMTIYDHDGQAQDAVSKKNRQRSFTVLGHVAVKHYTCSDRIAWDYTAYLPAQVYKSLVEHPAVMSYAFNVSDQKQAQVQAFLADYTDQSEPMMSFESKESTSSAFDEMKSTISLIGGTLGFVMALIGILNFLNAMLTSVVVRRNEFATLMSIGMTRRQLKTMLCWEGIYYAALSGAAALLLGTLFSLVVAKGICSQMWFLSYHLVLWPLALALPVLLLLGVAVSLCVYGAADTDSIVDRLRTA